MFNDCSFLYSEDRRKEILEDAERIRTARQLKGKQKKDDAELQQRDLARYMKTALAAILHR